jgi:phosphatidylethanolamine-binding protein (PEBP) family uncharacterized protein
MKPNVGYTLALTFIATLSASNAALAADQLGVKFTWARTEACSSIPPAFGITNVPKETKYLSFKLVDQNLPGYDHGGGKVAYKGSGNIPVGSFGGDYRGPCPPPVDVHTYEWTVQALDANKSVLAEGKARGSFPPK